eukprot:scaffold3529_cov271-Amphora_coffeaeformis.AAC.7
MNTTLGWISKNTAKQIAQYYCVPFLFHIKTHLAISWHWDTVPEWPGNIDWEIWVFPVANEPLCYQSNWRDMQNDNPIEPSWPLVWGRVIRRQCRRWIPELVIVRRKRGVSAFGEMETAGRPPVNDVVPRTVSCERFAQNYVACRVKAGCWRKRHSRLGYGPDTGFRDYVHVPSPHAHRRDVSSGGRIVDLQQRNVVDSGGAVVWLLVEVIPSRPCVASLARVGSRRVAWLVSK